MCKENCVAVCPSTNHGWLLLEIHYWNAAHSYASLREFSSFPIHLKSEDEGLSNGTMSHNSALQNQKFEYDLSGSTNIYSLVLS